MQGKISGMPVPMGVPKVSKIALHFLKLRKCLFLFTIFSSFIKNLRAFLKIQA